MKFRFLSVLSVALLVSIFLGLFLTAPIYSQTTGKIVGTVTDEETGKPLPGANIVLLGTYLGAAADIDGYYTIVNVTAGIHDVQVSMIGYAKVTQTDVIVAVDHIASVDFSLEMEVVPWQEVVVVAERDILHKEVSNSQQGCYRYANG